MIKLEIHRLWFPTLWKPGFLLPFLENALGVIVAFDLTQKNSYAELECWFERLEELREMSQFTQVFLIGCKADLDTVVSQHKLHAFLRNWEPKLGIKVKSLFISSQEEWYKEALYSEPLEIEGFFPTILSHIMQTEKMGGGQLDIKIVFLGDYKIGIKDFLPQKSGKEFTTEVPIVEGFTWTIHTKEFNL